MQPIEGFGVAKVVDSGHPEIKKGDLAWGATGWHKYSVIKNPEGLFKFFKLIFPSPTILEFLVSCSDNFIS